MRPAIGSASPSSPLRCSRPRVASCRCTGGSLLRTCVGCSSRVSWTRRAGCFRWSRRRGGGSPPCLRGGSVYLRPERCGGQSINPNGAPCGGSPRRARVASAVTRTPTDGCCGQTCAGRGGGFGTEPLRRGQGERSACDGDAHLGNSQSVEQKGELMAMKENAVWRDPALGVGRELDLRQGRLRYFEAGSGLPIVFAHGLLVNANLWRKVVAALGREFRCIALDLPLGSHTLPMPEGADLSPHGLADLIADAIEALELEEVALVGNDPGGALCQMVVTRRPERIGRLVLTSCDYRDNFPPAMFRYFKVAAAVPGAMKLLMVPMRLRAPRRLPFAFGWLVERPIDREAEDSYLLAGMTIPGVERDLKRVIKGVHTRYTNEAADRLKQFDKPALIAWSRDDRFFKPAHAQRLAQDLADARLEWIENARSLSPEDEPGRLAELIAAFARKPAQSAAESNLDKDKTQPRAASGQTRWRSARYEPAG